MLLSELPRPRKRLAASPTVPETAKQSHHRRVEDVVPDNLAVMVGCLGVALAPAVEIGKPPEEFAAVRLA